MKTMKTVTMKTSLSLVTLNLCCIFLAHGNVIKPLPNNSILDQKSLSSDIIFTMEQTILSNSSSSNVTCDKQYSCLDDHTVRICAPEPGGQTLHQIDALTCPQSTPWCDPGTGTCVIGQMSSNFTCMRDGIFPDFNECSRYFVCDKGVATAKLCLGSYPYYNPTNEQCVSYNYYCVNYGNSCNGVSDAKVPVRNVNNQFLYCNNSEAILVDRCIGAYVFDSDTQSCQPNCPSHGLFPSDQDCAQYYLCSYSNEQDTALTMSWHQCPQGQGFSVNDLMCVDKSLVENCNVANPGLFN